MSPGDEVSAHCLTHLSSLQFGSFYLWMLWNYTRNNSNPMLPILASRSLLCTVNQWIGVVTDYWIVIMRQNNLGGSHDSPLDAGSL